MSLRSTPPSGTTAGFLQHPQHVSGAPSPLSNHFLATLLDHKMQEASLLFALRDADGSGVLAFRHLRPMVLALFPAPQSTASSLFNHHPTSALYRELTSPQSVRAAFEAAARRPVKVAAAGAGGQMVFTLSELRGVMDRLFLADPRDAHPGAAFPAAGQSILSSRQATPPAAVQRPSPRFHDALEADDNDLPARYTAAAASSEEPKEFCEDSTQSTGRSSSVGGQSSAFSYCTTTTAAGATGVLETPFGGNLRVVGTVAGSGSRRSMPLPPQQMALMWGSLAEAFGKVSSTDGRLDGGAIVGRPLSNEQLSALACVLKANEAPAAASVGKQDVAPGSRFDAFLQFVLSI